MRTPVLVAAFVSALALPPGAGALGGRGGGADNLCSVASADEAMKACAPGDLMLFRPPTWGNAQLPVAIAALFCDFDRSVVWTEGAVACVFRRRVAREP